MYSLRQIFRYMLLGWFAVLLAMAFLLTEQMPVQGAGTLASRLFADPPAPPVIEIPPPHRSARPPAPAPWQTLPNTRAAGEGRLGTPAARALTDGAVEVLLSWQGKLGGETRFSPKVMGRDKSLRALSVDLHGIWKLDRASDLHPGSPAICRIQIYPHPDYVRFSAIACEGVKERVTATAGFSAGQIRLLFALDRAALKAESTARPG